MISEAPKASRSRPRKALGPNMTLGTTDSFRNFTARLGKGTGNQSDNSHYAFNPVTRNRLQMEYVYRGSWIGGRVVDVVARDMTRAGAEVLSSDDPGKIAEFDKEVERLQVWTQLCSTTKWARLYGGSLAFMMIEGQNPATPLRLETLQKNQFRGLLPLDRWVVNPSLGELVEEFGPTFGKPMFYDTVPDTGGMPRMKVHHSRVIRIPGVELPYWQSISENLWDQSVLERMWDRLISFDSTTLGAAQLVYKAHLRTLSVDGLRDMLGGNAAATAGLLANIEFMRYTQSNEGISLVDTRDKFEAHQYAFGGLDNVLMQFSEQLAGATDIPLVRLFGQSPKGFSTGDTDLRNYYDSVKQQQVTQLGPGVNVLYRVIYINKFGTEPPKDFEVKFRPLWQMTDPEKAEVTSKVSTAINSAFESQLISRSAGMKELKQLSKLTGAFSNITDEEIAEAENDPPPTPEAQGLVLPEPEPPAPGEPGKPGGKPAAAKSPARDSLWSRLARAWDALLHADRYAQPDGPHNGDRTVAGLVIHIENQAGTQRAPQWPVLASHYGEILGTQSADADPVDVFLKEGTPDDYAGPLFVIDQPKLDGTFDEHKVMLGWATQEEAVSAYLASYQVGWRLGPVTTLSVEQFHEWLDKHNKHPLSNGRFPLPQA